jgi:hypothetical protein
MVDLTGGVHGRGIAAGCQLVSHIYTYVDAGLVHIHMFHNKHAAR